MFGHHHHKKSFVSRENRREEQRDVLSGMKESEGFVYYVLVREQGVSADPPGRLGRRPTVKSWGSQQASSRDVVQRDLLRCQIRRKQVHADGVL